MLNIASVAPRSEIYGPGVRFVIWVQGCALGCPGCWNTELWSLEPRRLMSPDELAREILRDDGLEGITLLGGEPMHQARGLLRLVRLVRRRGLSVMTYTGFEPVELRAREQRALAMRSDILVTGRYVAAERDVQLRWRGSRNQQVRFPTPRYRGLGPEEANEVEITLDANGVASLRGYPPEWLLDRRRSRLLV